MGHESLLKFVGYGTYTVLGGSLAYILLPMAPPTLKSSVVELILQQLTVLIVVALFLERALEVYKLFYFSPEKERLVTQVEYSQLELQTLLEKGDNISSTDNIQSIQSRLFESEASLRVYRNNTRQRLLQTAIVFGVLIGLVGMRSLESVIVFPTPNSIFEIFRLYLFRGLDIILTAGLIAGGSEGVHNIFKKVNSLFPDIPSKILEFIQAIRQNAVKS
ncbi:MAG: hypothetical protein AAF821_18855 [Cyanobacteria bacterium P01_D01_bin.156]